MKSWRAKSISQIADEPYMADPEFAASHGVSGLDVAAKVALIQTPVKRSLLLFLQAMFMRSGGAKRFTAELLKSFPERLGTPEMHKDGIRPGKVFSLPVARMIDNELHDSWCWLTEPASIPSEERTAEFFLDSCRRKALDDLPRFLVELCRNPTTEIRLADKEQNQLDRSVAMELRSDLEENAFCAASVGYFSDLIGALFEYQKRVTKSVRQGFASTKIAQTVFRELDYCLRTGQIVVIEGQEGLGKSEAARVWCETHYGEARLVRLSSITNRTTFFRTIAESLGIGAPFSRTSAEIQTRVEKALHDSRLALVIDEAHAILPQGKSVSASPALLDWVYSALQNYGVPCALISTPQFSFLMNRVEQQTGWNAGQFKRRVKRFIKLPDRQSAADLEAVAKTLLPSANKNVVRLIVGYAGGLVHQMDGVVDLVREARLLAESDGRLDIMFQDVERAIDEILVPTAQAKQSSPAPTDRGRRPRSATALNNGCNSDSDALKASLTLSGETIPPPRHFKCPNEEARSSTVLSGG